MYRARNLRASPLWQCAQRHRGELREAGRFQRAVEERTIERFMECGDPHHGFARVYCDACGHDYLLAFSCKTRYFCPSCHQKRVLLYGEWVEETVLAPVPHRQYVFTLPRLLRHIFARRRRWLEELCCIAERLLSHAYAEALPGGSSALIVFVQTFGDLVNFNPHLHVLAADGAFLPDGRFVALPPVPGSLLAEGFRRAVLDYLVENEALSKELRARMLAWRHGGFSAHNEVSVAAENAEGRKKLAGTMLRAPMSLQKMTDDATMGTLNLPLKDARRLEAQLPDHAGCRVVGVTLQTHSRPLRALGALRGVVLEPRARRAREESLAPSRRRPAFAGRGAGN